MSPRPKPSNLPSKPNNSHPKLEICGDKTDSKKQYYKNPRSDKINKHKKVNQVTCDNNNADLVRSRNVRRFKTEGEPGASGVEEARVPTNQIETTTGKRVNSAICGDCNSRLRESSGDRRIEKEGASGAEEVGTTQSRAMTTQAREDGGLSPLKIEDTKSYKEQNPGKSTEGANARIVSEAQARSRRKRLGAKRQGAADARAKVHARGASGESARKTRGEPAGEESVESTGVREAAEEPTKANRAETQGETVTGPPNPERAGRFLVGTGAISPKKPSVYMAPQRASNRKNIGAEGSSLAQVTLSKFFGEDEEIMEIDSLSQNLKRLLEEKNKKQR